MRHRRLSHERVRCAARQPEHSGRTPAQCAGSEHNMRIFSHPEPWRKWRHGEFLLRRDRLIPACHWLCGTRRQTHVNDERSEEHTSELQSRLHLVCRLLLEKKKADKHVNSDKDLSN